MIRPCNDIYLFLCVIILSIVQNDAIRHIPRSEILDHMAASAEAGARTTADEGNNNNNSIDDDYPDVEELFVTQDLDHLDNNVLKLSFKQRYFYSSRYVHKKKEDNSIRSSKKKKTYVFLCMGGEGPSMDKSVLVDSVHCSGDMLELASKLHKEKGADVHVFALEHRYYGKSYPSFQDGSSPVENKNLKYLSSKQALWDVNHFVTFATIHHLDMVMVRWVTFGGSYPGMLAAWSRLEMPSLIYAAVSNSAPVQATVNMYQYNDYVSHILKDETIGGSHQCHHIIHQGHEDLAKWLKLALLSTDSAALENIASLFHICDADSLKHMPNIENFLSESVIDIPMQSNDPSCDDDNCNIEKLCDTVIRLEKSFGFSPMYVLADIRSTQRVECDNIEWQDQLDYLSSMEAQKGGLRSWLWQTCNEFGFYQTCQHNTQCPFAQGFHTLRQDFDICQVAFNVTADQVKTNVHNTIQYYKGWDMNITRVFNVNGDVDPWSTLAITPDHPLTTIRNYNSPKRYMVKGASHHFWTHKVQDSDTDSIHQAREQIYKQVIAWLDLRQDDENTETRIELE